jgi:tetratricopeptide (TPR) repeat protein
MKRTKKALAIFDMIIEMDPQNQVALLNAAELLSESGEHEAALRAVDRVLALVPNHPDALKLRSAVVEAGRAAAEAREKEAAAEDAESVFGGAPRPAAAPAFAAGAPATPAQPPAVSAPEDDFETI